MWFYSGQWFFVDIRNHTEKEVKEMNFTKLIIIFSAILQITFAYDNYKFKPQKIGTYEIQETIIVHSSMECCIHCRINFFCEAVLVSEGNNCILLTQIQSDTWASDASASDTSAYVLQNR